MDTPSVKYEDITSDRILELMLIESDIGPSAEAEAKRLGKCPLFSPKKSLVSLWRSSPYKQILDSP